MKKILFTCCLLSLSCWLFGQGQYAAISEVNVTEHRPAVRIVLAHSPEVVLKALSIYKDQPDLSTKRHPQAYQSFQNTALIHHNTTDAHLTFKVGEETPGDNSKTVVYLLLNSMADNGSDAVYFDPADARALLDNLSLYVNEYAAFNLNQEVKLQTSRLAKQERLQKKCNSHCVKLDAKKKAMQQRMTHNKRNGDKQFKELDRRIAAGQYALASHKTAVNKQRAYLLRLTNQQVSNSY